MKKLILIITIVLLGTASIVYFYKNQLNSANVKGIETNKTLKIGVILPLTGLLSQFGEGIQEGVLQAEKELRSQGSNVEIIIQDDGYTNTGVINAAKNLIEIQNVDILVTATVQEFKPLVPYVDQKNIPLLLSWDSNELIKKASKNVFTVGFSTERAGQRIASFASSKKGVKTASILSCHDEWSEIISQSFSDELTKAGGKILSWQRVECDYTDFRSHITKIVSEKPDAVYFPLQPGQLGTFLAQLKALGFKGIILAGDTMSPDEYPASQGAEEGMYFTGLYNGTPFPNMGYDSIMTIIAANQIRMNENISFQAAFPRTKLISEDRTIDFAGKNYSDKEETLYQVINKQFIEIK